LSVAGATLGVMEGSRAKETSRAFWFFARSSLVCSFWRWMSSSSRSFSARARAAALASLCAPIGTLGGMAFQLILG